MNRVLDTGRVIDVKAKYALVSTEKYGQIRFPFVAAKIGNPNIHSLKGFKFNDAIVFTARQVNGRYVISSAVKNSQLIATAGIITEIDWSKKFCCVQVHHYGKVFVPFSARRTGEKECWFGKDAKIGNIITVRIFRQPDFNGYKHVAYSVSWRETEKEDVAKQTEEASSQIGIIVVLGDKESSVYSSVSGLCKIPNESIENWMQLGRWMRYDKQQSFARNIEDLGELYPVHRSSSTDWCITLYGVINKTIGSPQKTWAWNDMVGRIHVHPMSHTSFKPMDVVEMTISYNGQREDIPWMAGYATIVSNCQEQLRMETARLLVTDDDWHIKHVSKENVYAIIFNQKFGSGFVTFSDLNDTEQFPKTGTKVRATVFEQHRDSKHKYRAVLVTPLSEYGLPQYYHPAHNFISFQKYEEDYDMNIWKTWTPDSPLYTPVAFPCGASNSQLYFGPIGSGRNIFTIIPGEHEHGVEPNPLGFAAEDDEFVGANSIFNNCNIYPSFSSSNLYEFSTKNILFNNEFNE